jgi:hypothetical protein
MPVQTQPDALKVAQLVFEARFDEGYRYLDKCGELLVRIRRHSARWVPTTPNPQLAALSNEEHKLILNVNTEHMVLATAEELPSSAANKTIEIFGSEAEILYRMAAEALSVPNTTRVGLRCRILAGADSLEEANRFMCRLPGSALREEVLQYTHFQLRNTSVSYTLEDPESGLRRSLNLSSVARVEAGAPPITGLASDQGSGFVLVDIDTFTRPDQGHLNKLNVFIQESYAASRDLAAHVLHWLVKRQAK